MELVSIAVISRNHSIYLEKCLDNLLRQTYEHIEVILIDDNSTDGTYDLVDSIDSSRLKYHKNESSIGLARLRNVAISVARGNFIFFTDADCIPAVNWVEEGMKILIDEQYAGVEGYTTVENQNFGLSTHFVENTSGGQYQTCNVAYKKEYLIDVGLFDPRYSIAYEDVDLALRIKNISKIAFCKDMLVFHQLIPWSIKSLLLNSRRAKYKVILIKQHDLLKTLPFRIVEPNSLIQALFPILIPLYFRIKSPRDVCLIPFMLLRAILHRLIIWKTAINLNIFVI